MKNTPLYKFSVSFFLFSFLFLLCVVGVHIGIIVGMSYANWPAIVMVHIIVVYWIAVAAAMTLFARNRIQANYEQPAMRLIEATQAVAKGDFSVRIPTVHGPEHYDYFDHMILDVNRMIEELRSIETLKTDFVSNVSHEMKTPLAVIRNYAELLRDGEITRERRAEYAAAIAETSERLSSLITNILRLNRLENQRIVPAKRRFDVCRQLADCMLQFEEQWEAKGLDAEAALEERAYIEADEELLTLVWNNLISNAIKFTPSGGRISVSQRTEGAYVIVSVADTGCGMDADTLRHSFDRFYQGDASRATEGNGLGLALAKRVIDLTGGEIKAESAPGKGSVFEVRLRTA